MADITDVNIEDRMDKFVINTDKVYRIPLRYFCDIGKINFLVKTDLKIKCNLETEMKKLFELKKKVTNITSPDAKIIFTKAHFIQFEQFLLNKNFRQYIKAITISSKILEIGIQKPPLRKTYEMSIGSQSFSIDFLGSNRQFYWLEISVVFDKSDKRSTMCDSYNVKKAAQFIKSVELGNISQAYSLTNQRKYEVSHDTHTLQTICRLEL